MELNIHLLEHGAGVDPVDVAKDGSDGCLGYAAVAVPHSEETVLDDNMDVTEECCRSWKDVRRIRRMMDDHLDQE